MNRRYRLVWSRAHGAWVAASENTRSRSGKAGRTARPTRMAWLLALPLGLPLVAGAAPPAGSTTGPTGGHVTAGIGSIEQGQHSTTIRQGSQNLSLGWQTFNVGARDTVNFVQPNAQAIAVNRIADTRGSVILGRLNANGQVFLINPNGVLFGRGAQVNVGGLVASTLNVADSELGRGTLHFGGDGTGRVVNQGTITAASGGYVALLGHAASNQGTISAPAGTVALAGGEAVTLRFDGNQLLDMQVDRSTLDALAENRQLIVADGGQVLMSAGARDSLLASVVNNSGVIQARTVEHRAGKIVLLGGMAAGTTKVAGTLDASAPSGGDGGFIETSAAHVQVQDSARITTAAAQGKTGTWLIDPVDFTIAASGGDITGVSLGSSLASANVVIQSISGSTGTAGDVNVNDQVSWSANQLTLNAQNDININADLNGSGTARLALEYGQATVAGTGSGYTLNGARVNLAAGNNFSTRQGSGGATQVYTVVTNLGVAADTTTTSLQGIDNNPAGHYVLGGDIDASATSGWNGGDGFDPIGDIGTPFTGTFEGLGHAISGLTINRPSENKVGLFGYASGADLRNIGLLGGSIAGNQYVGGLVGDINSGTITRAYATSVVTGYQVVGGLVGSGAASTISEAYATGEVIASTSYVGGLVGQLADSGSTITHAYATGAVSGTYDVGGLVGYSAGSISGVYATGAVTTADNTYSSGLVGVNNGAITAGYWDSYSTGRTAGVGYGSAIGVTAITSDPAHAGDANYAYTPSTYAAFDFTPGTGAWFMVDGSTRPFLQSEYSTTISNTHQLQLMAMNLAATYTLASDLDASATARAVNSGAAADASGMWSNAGFKPIGGSFPNWFSGSFDGLGHTIAGLTINRPSTDYVGLFGATLGGTISHVGLLGGSVIGRTQVGGLVGRNNGQVDRAYATGTVNGTTYVGGLVGFSAGSITNTYATGAVSGTSDVGGLVGRSEYGTLSQAYAMGAVNGQDNVGGLIGTNWHSTISQTYATGQVVGTGANVGGLVGWNNSGTTTDSYWATDTSGQNASAGGTAQTLAGLIAAMPAGFDTTTVWGNQGNQTTPYLLNDVGPVFVAGGGSTQYTPVFTLAQLQAIDSGVSSLAGSYALFADIDASATSGWNGGAGFDPIGDNSARFTGAFDGLGHTISGLTIDRPTTVDIGLFGFIGSGSEIRNIGLIGGSVTGQETVGGLVGYNHSSTVRNAYATGAVNGNRTVGGLVGYAYQATIDNAYATGTVSGTADSIGGLVGGTHQGAISHAYATGTVSGTSRVGGLVGDNNSAVSQSYATGAVSGSATYVGGLIGANNASGSITTSYWDTQTTGQNHSAGSADTFGLTSADMLKASSFVGWDLATTGGSNAVWRIYEGQTGPLLRSFMTALTVTANDATATYNGAAWAGSAGYTTGALTPTTWRPSATVDASLILGSVGASVPAINAGSYALDSGLSSGQLGYDITVTSGTLTIGKATLTYHATPTSIEAGQSPAGLTGTIEGLAEYETLADATTGTLTWTTPATATSAAGPYAINGGGLSAGNYVFAQASGNSGALTVEPVEPAETAESDALSMDYMSALAALDGIRLTFGNTASHPEFGELAPQTNLRSLPLRVTGTGILLP